MIKTESRKAYKKKYVVSLWKDSVIYTGDNKEEVIRETSKVLDTLTHNFGPKYFQSKSGSCLLVLHYNICGGWQYDVIRNGKKSGSCILTAADETEAEQAAKHDAEYL